MRTQHSHVADEDGLRVDLLLTVSPDGPADEVLWAMKEARVPSGPIYSVQDICEDPQFIARGMFQQAAPPEGARPPDG